MTRQKKVLMKNLQIVIIDEVSMVKSDFLYMLDLCLQEVKENSRPFGGVSILAFGDFCSSDQLWEDLFVKCL